MSAKKDGKKVTSADRRSRLAEELRANLKRRKAGKRANMEPAQKAGLPQTKTDR